MTTVDHIRWRVAAALRQRVAGSDFEAAHTRIFDAPGPRWFTAADPIWRVHADASMFVGGIRALLLQSLHPRAMAAVSRHSGFRADPWGRLQRTSAFLAATTYGSIDAAERMIGTVNRIHSRISGITRDGLPYRADEPELLTWVHVAEVDSFLAAHDHFGSAPLTGADRDTYVAQTALIARRLGVVDPPKTESELDDLLESYRDRLRMSEEAREAADLLLRDPPLAGLERVGYATLAVGAVSTLPTWARVELLLPSLPITERLIARPITRTTLSGVRWAMAALA